MGLQTGLQFLGKAIAKSGDDIAGIFYRQVKPINPELIKGLRFEASAIGDTVCFSRESWQKLIPNLQEKINSRTFLGSGIEASVYRLDENYVLRISNKTKSIGKQHFKPLQDIFDGRNYGQAVAISDDGMVTINKFVKGKPLYGPNWNIRKSITLEEFYKGFNEIKALPDETFADYIKNVINIRKRGYNIDSINPNNLLLDGKKINIVDIKRHNIEPKIEIKDFDSIINKFHLKALLAEMTPTEIKNFADEIKLFYDRMLKIAHKEGWKLHIPDINYNELQDLTTYLYHKDWKMIDLMR